MTDLPLHPSVLARQADCPHTEKSFVKGLADTTYRCMRCGESKASWEARKP